MTVFYCEGFETVGDLSTAGATVQANISATDSGGDGGMTFTSVTGGHGGDVSLIAGKDSIGLALEFPDLDTARAEWIDIEFPDGSGRHADYKVSTNGSVPEFCCGFRVYVPATITPSYGTINIWQFMLSSSSVQSTLSITNSGADLTWTPQSGSPTVIAGVLTPGEWNYVELWFKPTNSANGGFMNVYVDGSNVATIASQNVVSGTFFTTYGVRLGAGWSDSSQTGGENIAFDDIYCMHVDGVTHTGPLGDSKVVLLSPTSDLTPNDWTPSTGSDNYALIDEQDWDTSDYIDATTTGDADHYDLTTLAAADAVHGLRIDCVCIAVDGTPTLHLGFDDGTADEESLGVIGTGSTVQRYKFFETDPSGGAWDATSVNAVEATLRMTE